MQWWPVIERTGVNRQGPVCFPCNHGGAQERTRERGRREIKEKRKVLSTRDISAIVKSHLRAVKQEATSTAGTLPIRHHYKAN